jgi:sodium/potassium/calcium exchanger 6
MSIFWLFQIASFFMSLVWIYMLCNLIVDVLLVFELITGVSAALLGLTVLSWGNSLGDAFASVAVSKKGFGEMAFTGCVAGPVFNLLLGLGLTTIRCNLKLGEAGIVYDLDRMDTQTKLAIMTLVFTIFMLCVLIWLVVINNFTLQRWHARVLQTFYALITIATIVEAVA